MKWSINRIALLLVFVISLVWSNLLGQMPGYPAPRWPDLPTIETVEDLMPYARIFVEREYENLNPGIGLKRGEKVLYITTSLTDPMVVQAICRAIIEMGGDYTLVLRESVEVHPAAGLRARGQPSPPTPAWLTEAMSAHDIILGPSPGNVAGQMYTMHAVKSGKPYRLVWMPYTMPSLLASQHMTFPTELLQWISDKVWNEIEGSREIRITEPEGTDITFYMDDAGWKRYREGWVSIGGDEKSRFADRNEKWKNWTQAIRPGHLTFDPALASKGATGVIVASHLHSDVIPRMTWYVEDGQVTRIEGGGGVGEVLGDLHQKHSSINFGWYRGTGSNWIEEVSLAMNPKAHRVYPLEEYVQRGTRVSFGAGRKRSGHIHIAVGSGPTRVVEGVPRQHLDVEIYFPTMWVDGKKIVDKGDLLALEDPETRAFAAKFGDPDELLKVEWVPRVVGVNH